MANSAAIRSIALTNSVAKIYCQRDWQTASPRYGRQRVKETAKRRKGTTGKGKAESKVAGGKGKKRKGKGERRKGGKGKMAKGECKGEARTRKDWPIWPIWSAQLL